MAGNTGNGALTNLLPQSSVVVSSQLLGEGGYSKVWRATYTDEKGNDIFVAAKEVQSCSLEDKEILTMQGMNHENIIKFYGVWKGHDDKVYIIMELAEKGDLRSFLNKCKQGNKRLTKECVLKWTYQGACALQYLKEKNLSHRDIKSLNFLITAANDLKLGDLGLATQLYETRHTDKHGTVHWMAPEVYRDQLRSPKSDIFSFSLVIWEMVTLDTPYTECKGIDYKVMTAVCQGIRPEVPLTCPEVLGKIMKCCWEDDREKRPEIQQVCQMLSTCQCTFTDIVEPASGVKAAKTSMQCQLLGIPEAKVYPMKNSPHGLCVIINNIDFTIARAEVSEDFSDRSGSEVDTENLKDLFEQRLNYIVEVHTDLTAEATYDLLQEKRKTDHSSFDSFVCCIMTHGRKGRVYGCDGHYLSIEELTGIFKARICKSLAGKPKFFVFEACQIEDKPDSDKMETDGNGGSSNMQFTQDEADFILGYATVPFRVAYRHPTEGSWYINVFVDTIKKAYDQHDVLKLLGIINERMGNLKTKENTQTSLLSSTLKKCFYLFDVQGAKASERVFKTC